MHSQKVVYFEKQSQDLLCGLHCLNSLMQGPLFDEPTLAQIAHQLDEQEKALYGGEVPQSMSNAGGGSYNVAGSGNFSIQVLESALHNHSGQKLVNITKLA